MQLVKCHMANQHETVQAVEEAEGKYREQETSPSEGVGAGVSDGDHR